MIEIRKCKCINMIDGRVCGFEYIGYNQNMICPCCKSTEHIEEEVISFNVKDMIDNLS